MALPAPAPSVEQILGNSPLRRLQIEEIAAIHVREHGGDDRPTRRVDDPDVVAE